VSSPPLFPSASGYLTDWNSLAKVAEQSKGGSR